MDQDRHGARVSVRIPIADNLVLSSDASNWIVAETGIRASGARKGQPFENAVGYYPTLESAVRGLLEYALRQSDAKSLRALRRDLRRLEALVRAELGTAGRVSA
jgi:hypothetical protein